MRKQGNVQHFMHWLIPSYAIFVLLSPYIHDLYLGLLPGFNSPSITQENFISTPFPLPPLAEQQRIVAKVDELMALCNELKTADTLPIAPASSATVIPFPARATAPEEPAVEEEYLIAARGNMPDAMPEDWKQAVDDLFGEERDA